MTAAPLKQRVVVIGAGIVGVASASWLQHYGHDVCLVEADEPGMGISFGNGGNFNASSVVPTALPGMVRQVPRWLADPLGPLVIRWGYLPRLAPWLYRFLRAGQADRITGQAFALRSLVASAMDALLPLVEAAGCGNLIQTGGTLTVYRSRANFERAAIAHRLRRETGVEMDILENDALHAFEPGDFARLPAGVLIRANASTSNPARLVQSLAVSFVASGGSIVKSRVRGFLRQNGKVAGVRTDAGTLAASTVVVAAGLRSAALARSLGDRIPLQTERGYHLMIRDPEVVPRMAISDMEGKFACTPMELGLRLAGTVELASEAAAADWRRSRILETLARRLLPGLAASCPEDRLSMWMGHRPSTPDSLPVIGRSRDAANVFYAFGHGHTGMAGGPMTGKVIAELVSGQQPSIAIEPFSACRF